MDFNRWKREPHSSEPGDSDFQNQWTKCQGQGLQPSTQVGRTVKTEGQGRGRDTAAQEQVQGNSDSDSSEEGTSIKPKRPKASTNSNSNQPNSAATSHSQSQSRPVSTSSRCQFCRRHFRNARLARVHEMREHLGEGDKVFRCHLCTKSLTTESDYEKHMRTHLDESDPEKRPFVCSLQGCGKRYTRAAKLEKHEKRHTGDDKPFECPYPNCVKSYRREGPLQIHISRNHPGQPRI